jgi:LPXTG-motif cell wall-anchored protein
VEYNPVAASDLIVAGRVTDWHALPKLNPDFALTPIQVTMSVERMLKGTASAQFQFGASLDVDSNSPTWTGNAGGCGVVFDADPKGEYFVLGLSKGTDGTYSASPLAVFSEGTQPTIFGDRFAQELAALGVSAPANLPNTGVASSFPNVLVGTGLLVLAIGTAFRLRRFT